MRRGLARILFLVFFVASPAQAGPPEEYKAAQRLLEGGEYIKAMDAFRRYIASHPDLPSAATALYNLGRSAEKAGQIEQARTAYRRFLTHYTRHELATFARQRLAEIGEGPAAPLPTQAGEEDRTPLASLQERLIGPEGSSERIEAPRRTSSTSPRVEATAGRGVSAARAGGEAGRLERTSAGDLVYWVGTGESLRAIAARIWGDEERYRDLARWNRLEVPYGIRPGDRLVLSPTGSGAEEAASLWPSAGAEEMPAAFPETPETTRSPSREENVVNFSPQPQLSAAALPSLRVPSSAPRLRIPSLAMGTSPSLRRATNPPPIRPILRSEPPPAPSSSAPSPPAPPSHSEPPAMAPAEVEAVTPRVEPLPEITPNQPLLPFSLSEIPLPAAALPPPPSPPAPVFETPVPAFSITLPEPSVRPDGSDLMTPPPTFQSEPVSLPSPAPAFRPPEPPPLSEPAPSFRPEPPPPQPAAAFPPVAVAPPAAAILLESTPGIRPAVLPPVPAPASAQALFPGNYPPSAGVVLGADAAQARISLASSFRRAGQLDQAEAELRAAITAAPNEPVAYNNLADLLLEEGRTAEAKGLVEQALALAPRNRGPYLDTLGWALYLLGAHGQALTRLDEAVQIEPTPTRLYHRALVYAALGQVPRARRDLEEARTYDPDPALGQRIRRALEDLLSPAPLGGEYRSPSAPPM